jgi:hypothetical protein
VHPTRLESVVLGGAQFLRIAKQLLWLFGIKKEVLVYRIGKNTEQTFTKSNWN